MILDPLDVYGYYRGTVIVALGVAGSLSLPWWEICGLVLCFMFYVVVVAAIASSKNVR
jgi:hypothetical protein